MSKRKVTIDWITVFTYLALVIIGLLAIYTADYDPEHPQIYYQGRFYGRQLIWIGVSLFIAFLIQILDSRLYTIFSYFIYGGVLILLLMTLLVGAEISGSKSWIRLGFFNFQPSEFAKFATCLALAKFLSSFNINLISTKEKAIAAGIIVLPMLFILLQGDAGSAIVFAALILVLYREGLSGAIIMLGVLAVMLFVLSLLFPFEPIMIILAVIVLFLLLYKERNNWQALLLYCTAIALVVLAVQLFTPLVFMGSLAAISVLFLAFSLYTKKYVYILLTILFTCSIYVKSVNYAFHTLLKPHQQNRIGVVLGTIEDNRGVGYNLNQSKIAIGSGGLTGKGFLQGTQNKGNFVPELSTDFIFCTIGEEFGFLGSLVMIGLFLFLLIRLIHISERQKFRFNRIYGYGVVSILFFHFAINIGMTVGLVPVIGIPLPFISYGGSSLMGFTILLFILIKLDAEQWLYI